MSSSLLALLGYCAWVLVLLATIAAQRTALTLTGAREANSFSPTGADVSPFSERLCRAHANCYEFFPVFGGLLLLAAAGQQTVITDPLAPWALAARLAQSVVHLASTSAAAVTLRFAFFLAQLGIAALWVVRLATA